MLMSSLQANHLPEESPPRGRACLSPALLEAAQWSVASPPHSGGAAHSGRTVSLPAAGHWSRPFLCPLHPPPLHDTGCHVCEVGATRHDAGP